ncbi:cytochrome o ubiquinol oxidase subunit IV [Novosphingobium pituita]|jgi:cytochrome o ubiquinol oxidase operon protein cyoD|uniref:Cytochrome bo(3) ubiquinol oxidase subunit 4 n=1 Tax=Novosphingobium pituita TaxID=3056842 RepID=A0ABQ6P615_9SPHN|nr:cytochrome o ubiquinol oxidase subunit IV [Novosphingobium sp. IK01]MDK4807328.1 cytochrome o ubiquinol oxidase subunit IV [Novosphingobium aromaticivorans]GMM60004.1 cytochrome o ubiquinol oxidase subunit IV [Novosphingobium sp. IK01]
MSALNHTDHGHTDHGHGDHGHHHEEAHGSMRDYVIGFVLSVILTAIPFAIVMGGLITDHHTAALVIAGFAAVQIVVHMVYFLHMNGKAEGGWNLLALIFTGVVVLIILSGSLWVMYHMNTNMMPMGAEQAAQMD